MNPLDEKDLCIIAELERDSGRTRWRLAKKLGLPLTTVHNRISKLEKMGVIRRYRAVIDKGKVGKSVGAIIDVSVNYLTPDFSQQEIARKIAALPEVDEVAIVTGGTDLIIKAHVSSTDELNEFLTKKLRAIKGIDKTNTAVILQEMEGKEGHRALK
ncbi:MAG: Lrp/AsnC family transcriptional regulator [Candidatus Micrarchaeota archaeon]